MFKVELWFSRIKGCLSLLGWKRRFTRFHVILRIGKMVVCGFLLGCMARCVGGTKRVSRMSLGQLGAYGMILGAL